MVCLLLPPAMARRLAASHPSALIVPRCRLAPPAFPVLCRCSPPRPWLRPRTKLAPAAMAACSLLGAIRCHSLCRRRRFRRARCTYFGTREYHFLAAAGDQSPSRVPGEMATEAEPAPARPVGPTRLVYFDDMWALRSAATVLAVHQEEGARVAVVLDATVFHPQGGGQPADTGSISAAGARFLVEDVRAKDGVVFHYGRFEGAGEGCEHGFKEGESVSLEVDAERRSLNSRLHSAGHLLDICVSNVGLSHLEAGKGYHFPDGPFVEYKGVIPPDQIQDKKNELETEAKRLISKGAKVLASVFPYEEAAKLCGGSLPNYISKDSNPRIIKFGEYPGGPCGGTHVADISVINSLKVTNIRVKKGLTKVSYSISP